MAPPACAGPGAEFAGRAFFLLCHDSSLKVTRWTAHERFSARNADYRGNGRPYAAPSPKTRELRPLQKMFLIKNVFVAGDQAIVMKLAALWTLLLPTILPARPDRFGLPACAGPGAEFADRVFFLLCHDSSLNVARWTAHEITPGRLPSRATQPSPATSTTTRAWNHPPPATRTTVAADFLAATSFPAKISPGCPSPFRATESNCSRTSSHNSKASTAESGVNSKPRSGAWLPHSMLRTSSPAPIFNTAEPAFIGDGQVAVPTHVFIVVLLIAGEERAMRAVIVPNSAVPGQPPARFLTSVDEVERRTGLDFFSALEDVDERRLESAVFGCLRPGDCRNISAASSTR